MKVLVTGATGFVGKHLVNRLKEEKCDVTEINSTNFSLLIYCSSQAAFRYLILALIACRYCLKSVAGICFLETRVLILLLLLPFTEQTLEHFLII